MSRRAELKGKQFGRLSVFEYISQKQKWRCVCLCGETKEVSSNHLTSGYVQSCGCIFNEMMIDRNTSHGLSDSSEYQSWAHMIQRCFNPKNPNYPRYGGKGITIQKGWELFENFILDMGMKPHISFVIDRIDTKKGYTKENCRWTTQAENNRNAIHSKRWIVDGFTFDSLSRAAKHFKVSNATILNWCLGRRDKKDSKPKAGCFSENKY